MEQISPLKRGVSLVENMAALLVFSTAALGWITLTATLSKATAESEVASQATVIADSLVNKYSAMKFEDEPLPGEQNPDLSNLAGADNVVFFNILGDEIDEGAGDQFFTATVEVNLLEDLVPKQADVAITVSWADSDFMQENPDDPDVLSFIELVFSRTVER